MKNTTILITGATGFLGHHLMNFFRKRGFRVYAFSEHGNAKAGVEKLSFLDIGSLSSYIQKTKPNIVYHTGAVVDLSRNYETAIRCIYANILGTTHLLDALSDSGIQRFIYTSTEEIYGSSPIPFREDGAIEPPSPYAVTKLSGEFLSQIYGRDFGFKVVVFRIGTMYGPEQTTWRFIPSIISLAINNKEIPLPSGTKKRDYIFITDVLRALDTAKDASFQGRSLTLNLGGGVAVRLIDMVEKIVKICRSSSRINVGVLSERASEADEWLMDISRAKAVLQWKPEIMLENGLKQTIEYYSTSETTKP